MAYIPPINSQKKIRVKIFRYDPTKDGHPRFETYEIPFIETMTVIEVLEYLWDHGTYVAFRSNCREFTCGSCTMLINRKPALACKTLAEDGMILEPLPIFPIIKDLIVDTTRLEKKYEELRLWPERLVPPQSEIKVSSQIQARYSELYHRCVECLACFVACPVASVAMDKFAGPMLMLQLARLNDNPYDQADRIRLASLNGLFHCSMCNKCLEVCPMKLDVPSRVIEPMRAAAVEKGCGPLPGSKTFANLVRETGRAVERTKEPFLKLVPEVIEPEGKPKREVSFFTGCLVDLRLQETGRALINVLRKNNVRVHIPKDQTCCGSPLLRTGQLQEVEKVVAKNVELFESVRNVDTVITVCAGCGLTLKLNWPAVYEKTTGHRPSLRVLDISEFLTGEINLNTSNMSEQNITVTYHDPCHLKRGQNVAPEIPRRIIRAIPGVKFVEMSESDKCCGAGGGLRSGNHDLSIRVAHKKVDSIINTGADIVTTICPFCIYQLQEVLQSQLKKIKVMNLVELINMAYA